MKALKRFLASFALINISSVPLYKLPKSPADILPVNCKSVYPVVYLKAPDLSTLTVKDRKKAFIDLILPEILIANCHLLRMRALVKKALSGKRLTAEEMLQLQKMMKFFKAKNLKELYKKVAPIPPSVAIAQAALESGWGTSRFFKQANNIFGVWSFSKRGVKAKSSEARLKVYRDLMSSVWDYELNVDKSWAYEDFRNLRNAGASPLRLIETLGFYSTLRKKYIRRLRRVIIKNNLQKYDNCKLFYCPDEF